MLHDAKDTFAVTDCMTNVFVWTVRGSGETRILVDDSHLPGAWDCTKMSKYAGGRRGHAYFQTGSSYSAEKERLLGNVRNGHSPYSTTKSTLQSSNGLMASPGGQINNDVDGHPGVLSFSKNVRETNEAEEVNRATGNPGHWKLGLFLLIVAAVAFKVWYVMPRGTPRSDTNTWISAKSEINTLTRLNELLNRTHRSEVKKNRLQLAVLKMDNNKLEHALKASIAHEGRLENRLKRDETVIDTLEKALDETSRRSSAGDGETRKQVASAKERVHTIRIRKNIMDSVEEALNSSP